MRFYFRREKRQKTDALPGVGRVIKNIGICGIMKTISITETAIIQVAEKFVKKMPERSLNI